MAYDEELAMWNEPPEKPGKRWSCWTCGEPIELNPFAILGMWRYRHVDLSMAHVAVRGPRPLRR